MGTQFDQITEKQREFTRAQKLFFVGSAAPDGRVNISPKGMDTLRILDDHRVIWLNYTGSGNETAAHLLEHPRMTLMFCAFDGAPNILRFYGNAHAVHPHDADWDELYRHFDDNVADRQIFDMTVDMTQESCGMGVPFFEHVGERAPDQLLAHFERLGADKTKLYHEKKNKVSLDGKPTGIDG